MATKTWAAPSDGNASTDSNWSPSGAPTTGDDVVFDSTSSYNCNWDINPALGNFTINTGYSGTVTQSSSFECVDFSLVAGNFVPSSTYLILVNGNFSRTGGTMTSGQIRIIMAGVDKTFTTSVYNASINTLQINEDTEIIGQGQEIVILYIDTGKTLTVDTPNYFICRMYIGGYIYNYGEIAGTGEIRFNLYNSDMTRTLGVINCDVHLYLMSIASASYSLILNSNTTLGGDLYIYSEHATYTATLSHGTNYTLDVSGEVTLGDRGCMTQGTGTWTFGSFTQDGVSSVFTQGGDWNVGTFLKSDGTLTANTSYDVTITGAFTIYITGSGQMNLIFQGTGDITTYSYYEAYSVRMSSDRFLYSGQFNSEDWTIDAGVNFTINGQMRHRTGASRSSWVNNGTITQSGGGFINFYQTSTSTTDGTLTLGDLDCDIEFVSTQTVTSDWLIKLGANGEVDGDVDIYSLSDTYTITMHHNSNYTFTATGEVTLGDRGKITQGTGAFTFGSYTQSGTGSVYTQGGNITVNGDMALSAGSFVPTTSYSISLYGNYNNSGATVTVNLMRLVMMGSGTTLDTVENANFYSLSFSQSATITSGSFRPYKVMVSSGKIATIADAVLRVRPVASATPIENNGTITATGTGYLELYFWYEDVTLSFGTVTCDVYIRNGAPDNVIMTLGANTTITGDVTIESVSSGVGYTMTVTHGSNYTFDVTGTLTLGDYGTITQGYSIWNWGNYVQSGTSSSLTGCVSTAYPITVSGSFEQTAGTISGGGTGVSVVLKMTGTGNLATLWDLDLSERFHTLTIDTSGTITITDDVSTRYDMNILNNSTVTINSGKYLGPRIYFDADFTKDNTATINGDGMLWMIIYSIATTGPIPSGTYSCDVRIGMHGGSNASTVVLTGNTTFLYDLTVISYHSTNLLTFTHGSNYTLSVSGTTQILQRAVVTQGTGLWTFDDFTQSGTGSVFTQGGQLTYNGNFTLSGGTYSPSAAYASTFNGNFTKSGGTYTTNAGQITMAGDGGQVAITGEVDCGILGITGNTTVTSGILRCITQFYNFNKTLTIDGADTRVMIYHTAVGSVNYSGTPTITSTNGGRLVLKLYQNTTLSANFQYITKTCDLEIGRYTGTAADVTLTVSQNLSIGQSNDLYITSEDETYYTALSIGAYSLTAKDITIAAKGYLNSWSSTGNVHCYGNCDGNGANGGRLYVANFLHMYTDGTWYRPGNGFTYGRIKYLYIHATEGETISVNLTAGQAMVIDNGGSITGDGGTFAIGDARVYLYTFDGVQPFNGTGRITSSEAVSTCGFYFICHVGNYATNINHEGWTMDCDICISLERSVTDTTITSTLSGDITTSQRIILFGGWAGVNCAHKIDLNGHNLTCKRLDMNATYSNYELIVDASTPTSTITITGTSFYCGYSASAITSLIYGDSHFVFAGSGTLHFYNEIEFNDVTVSGSYIVDNGNAHVRGTRTISGTLDQSLGYYLLYYMDAVSTNLSWNVREAVLPSYLYLNYAMITRHLTDPYSRLFAEVVSYLETETGEDGMFEGFYVYSNPPANQTLHFPCIVVSMERGDMGYLFGGEYDEGGTLSMKIMFTHKHVVTLDVL